MLTVKKARAASSSRAKLAMGMPLR